MEELEPVTHLEKYIAGEVQPTTHLEKVIEQYGGGGGGGGSITVDTAMSPTSTNPVQNKVIYAALAYAADIVDGKKDKPLEETISDTAASITPEANTIYNCGELTSLNISNPPATGAYSIVFTSGSTATETAFPAAILGLEDFAAEANTIYEINVLDNRAVYNGWGVR